MTPACARSADELRRKAPVVLERDQHLARLLDHVAVGHDAAVLRVHDDARARRELRLRWLQAEEAPEERVAEQRVLLLGRGGEHRYADHRRGDPLDHRRERRQPVASRDRRHLRRGELRGEQQRHEWSASHPGILTVPPPSFHHRAGEAILKTCP
jgi:hypothetical protein